MENRDNKSQAIRIIIRLTLFCLIFLILDRAIGWLLDTQYSKISTGPGRYNYIKTHRNDCLIMGSSTSTCYDDDILTKSLGMSVLNVGLDGSALIYSRCLLDLLIRNNTAPKLIILNIDLFEFRKSAWSGNYYSMMEQYRPLFGQSDFIDKALYKGKKLEPVKYVLSSYRYNDLPLSLIQKRLEKETRYARAKSSEDILALPIDDKTLKEKFSNELDIDQRKINLLKEFVSVCREKGIRIILIESPIYYPNLSMTKRDRIIEGLIKKTAQEMDVSFIPLTQDTCNVFTNNRLFVDVLHLNHEGSIIFSGIVSDKIKKKFLEKKL
jgi:hypothetical protein